MLSFLTYKGKSLISVTRFVSGTSYEVQLFASHAPDVLPRRRKMVQMSLRVYERIPKELPPRSDVVLQKHYVFSDKPLMVTAKLDQGVYEELSTINVSIKIQRRDESGDSTSGHGVKKIKVMAVQQVIFLLVHFSFKLIKTGWSGQCLAVGHTATDKL